MHFVGLYLVIEVFINHDYMECQVHIWCRGPISGDLSTDVGDSLRYT
uniref:Uncharacterized protein n=1 Tax=Anguilla anguilla TaxID=7936 RepID=A0A0E9UPC8_ANGAN